MRRSFPISLLVLILSQGCGPAKIAGEAQFDADKINLSFTSNVNGPTATLESGPVTLVRPGKISVENFLKTRDGGELSTAALQEESPFLRLYVTDYEPKDSKEVTKKKVWWWQNWDKNLTFDLPNSVVNKKLRLYVTLSKVSPKSNRDTFIQTVPLDLFVDGRGSGVNWISPPQFVAAAKDAEIALQVEFASQGAPIEGSPTAESTTDGVEWSDIALEKWEPVKEKQNTYSFSIKYPFAEEKPFRIRLKVKDTIGNLAVSNFSPNLVGRRLFLFQPATPSERAACKDASGAPASRLAIASLSTVLCRARGVNGEATTVRKLPVLIDNRGAAAFKLAKDVIGLVGGLGYGLTAGGNDLRYINLVNPRLTTKDLLNGPMVHYWEMEPSRIEASSRIWVTLDRNQVGKYSSSGTTSQVNTCYAANPGFPTAELQNRAAGLVLQDSVFPCDE